MRKKKPETESDEIVLLDDYDSKSRGTRRSKTKKTFPDEQRYHIDIRPRTDSQEIALRSLQDNIITILTGSAGTGKTYLAIAYAMREISRGNYDRLILSRTSIPTGKSLGFFPGDVSEKMYFWLLQSISYCKEFVGKATVDCWMKSEEPKIILEPMETLRGRNYDNSIVVIEEAQQLSWDEIKMLSTRIGENTKLVFTGDTKQRDVSARGIETLIGIVQEYDIRNVGIVKFTPDDIVRSDIVKELIMAYERKGL